jgi:hypothetical protein
MAKKDHYPNSDRLALGVYSGAITPKDLPTDVYYFNSSQIKGAAEKGLKIKFSEIDYNTPNFAKVEACRLNIYKFSAAKTFHQTLQMSDAMVKGGKIIPFEDFKVEVEKINDLFNETWLETEYNTAYGQSQMISQWNRFESEIDILPYLQYLTGSGEATCEICAPLDNVTLPVNDGFWDKFSPLQHFNCACMIIQLSKEEAKRTAKKEVARLKEEITPLKHGMFMTNAGRSGIIFNKETPYFNIPKQYKEFAKQNFNLPIPKKG